MYINQLFPLFFVGVIISKTVITFAASQRRHEGLHLVQHIVTSSINSSFTLVFGRKYACIQGLTSSYVTRGFAAQFARSFRTLQFLKHGFHTAKRYTGEAQYLSVDLANSSILPSFSPKILV